MLYYIGTMDTNLDTNLDTNRSNRLDNLKSWLASCYKLNKDLINLIALNNDASFRKYYRFIYNNQSFIAVDSPPTQEKNNEFIAVQNILYNNNVNVPSIISTNLEQGYFILEDFGDEILLPKLLKADVQKAERLYMGCIDQLIKIQLCSEPENFPVYDTDLLNYEMDLFTDWFINKYLGLTLSSLERSLLDKIFLLMIENAQIQPKVLVHRDFHSRNLMELNIFNTSDTSDISDISDISIGVIDFQDAVWGPLTYDLISLFRDCYISWDLKQIKLWTQNYFNQAQAKNIINSNVSFDQYWHWFLQMSLQRNFKTIGIFSRLFLRDNKPVYLGDIPRTLNYALEVTALLACDKQYTKNSAAFANMHDFLVQKIQPALNLIDNKDKILLND